MHVVFLMCFVTAAALKEQDDLTLFKTKKKTEATLEVQVPKAVRFGDLFDAKIAVNTTSITVLSLEGANYVVVPEDIAIVPDENDDAIFARRQKRFLFRCGGGAKLIYFQLSPKSSKALVIVTVGHQVQKRQIKVYPKKKDQKCTKINFDPKFVEGEPKNLTISLKTSEQRGALRLPLPWGLELIGEPTTDACVRIVNTKTRPGAVGIRFKHRCRDTTVSFTLPVLPRYSGDFLADPAVLTAVASRSKHPERRRLLECTGLRAIVQRNLLR